MTNLYDHEFRPWRTVGDRRIVIPEIRLMTKEPPDGPLRVRVIPDVFEPWDGPLLDVSGRATPDLTMQKLLSRMFELFDRLSHLTWLLETAHPENVAGMMPPKTRDYVDRQGYKSKVLYPGGVRPNVWLYAKVNTQREADSRIPHLMDVPAAVRGLVMEPRELIRFGKVPGFNLCGSAGQELLRRLHVVIRGGDEPLHPDNVRYIVRQCEDAGVPVWYEFPVDGREVKQLPEAKS